MLKFWGGLWGKGDGVLVLAVDTLGHSFPQLLAVLVAEDPQLSCSPRSAINWRELLHPKSWFFSKDILHPTPLAKAGQVWQAIPAPEQVPVGPAKAFVVTALPFHLSLHFILLPSDHTGFDPNDIPQWAFCMQIFLSACFSRKPIKDNYSQEWSEEADSKMRFWSWFPRGRLAVELAGGAWVSSRIP